MAERDELTLGELLLVASKYFKYFLSKWYLIILGTLVGVSVFGYLALNTPEIYDAPLTFLLTEDQGNQMAGAGAILGNLGLGGGGEGGNVPYQLLELGRSRNVLSQVLLDSAEIDGENRMIADHIILKESYYENRWFESDILKDFLFNGKVPSAADRNANLALKSIYGNIIQETEGLQSIKFDDDTGIFTIKSRSSNAELAQVLTEKTYEKLSDYFTESTIANQRNVLNLLSYREDSIAQNLALAEAELARYQDRSGGMILRRSSIQGEEIRRRVAILSTMYMEIIKNRETSAFLLAKKRPVFTLIDPPLQPLSAQRISIVKKMVTGGALGFVIVIIILFFNKLFRTALEGSGRVE